MKTQPTEITTTPTQRQRWRIEILITHQIMKLGHKGAGQQTTTPFMNMNDNGSGKTAQSKPFSMKGISSWVYFNF